MEYKKESIKEDSFISIMNFRVFVIVNGRLESMGIDMAREFGFITDDYLYEIYESNNRVYWLLPTPMFDKYNVNPPDNSLVKVCTFKTGPKNDPDEWIYCEFDTPTDTDSGEKLVRIEFVGNKNRPFAKLNPQLLVSIFGTFIELYPSRRSVPFWSISASGYLIEHVHHLFHSMYIPKGAYLQFSKSELEKFYLAIDNIAELYGIDETVLTTNQTFDVIDMTTECKEN